MLPELSTQNTTWTRGGSFASIAEPPPDKLRLLDYQSCADVNGYTDVIDPLKDTAVAAMFGTDHGTNAAPLWDQMAVHLVLRYSLRDDRPDAT